MVILGLLLGCALVSSNQKEELLDPDGDGSAWPDDCDNTDPEVHPGVPEVCDGLDQDCDDEIDEDAVDPLTFYADLDGDGFGDPDGETTASCTDPGAGWVELATDCDDEDGTVYPGAPLTCNDRRLNDCDGDPYEEAQSCMLSGELDMGSATDRAPFYILQDTSQTGARGFGSVLLGAGGSLVGDATINASDGLIIGAPEDEGLVSAVYWPASPWPDSLSYDADAEIAQINWTGETSALLGGAIASVGATCGEETLTLVVGAPGLSTLYLLTLPEGLSSGGPINTSAIVGSLSGDAGLGASLGAEGSGINAAWEPGEPLSVVVAGAPEANSAGFLKFMSSDDCATPEEIWTTVDAPDGVEGFGTKVVAGNLSGSEATDLIVSADDDGAASLWFFDGDCAGSPDCGERIDLGELRGEIGALQIAGVSGNESDPCQSDGYLDLLVGAPQSGEDERGQVMILEGSSVGLPTYNPAGLNVRTGVDAGDHFGASVLLDFAALGAGPTEGLTFLLVGAPGVEIANRNTVYNEGAVYGWIGDDLASWCGGEGDLDPSFILQGDSASELGSALGRLHDMDSDPLSLPEFGVGAPGHTGGVGQVLIAPLFPY